MFHHKHNQRGFTLIEMIVALAIFSLTILLATNVYLLVSNTQRRALAAQKILDDVRALFETMTQEVRLGTINYAYYDQQNIDLHPAAGTGIPILAVISQTGSQDFFRLQSERVQFCEEITVGDCDAGGTGWLDVTPEGVRVEDLRFVITPSADPFTAIEPVDCALGGDADCTAAGLVSYRCAADNACRYFSNGNNIQPQVLIMIKSTSVAPRLIEQASVDMQTIISSRIITSAIQNSYHD